MLARLKTSLYSRVPLLIMGPPGVGKTSFIRAACRELGVACYTVIASTREPSDFGGLPIVKSDKLKTASGELTIVDFAPPRYAVKAAETGGVIFFDEITCTPLAVQAPLLRVINELVVGDFELPCDKVAVVAAANPPDQAAGGWNLEAPLANRFSHTTWQLNTDEWLRNFPTYWGSPPTMVLWGQKLEETLWAQYRALVASYINVRRGSLFDFPKASSDQSAAWPSPRTWEFVSRQLAVADTMKLSRDDRHEIVCGTVGQGHGMGFNTWVDALDLPDPEALIKDPEKLKLPDRGDQQYAILTSVTAAVVANNTPARWISGWRVLAEAAKQAAPDIATVAAIMLAQNRPKGDKSSRYATIPPDVEKVFRPIMQAAQLIPR